MWVSRILWYGGGGGAIVANRYLNSMGGSLIGTSVLTTSLIPADFSRTKQNFRIFPGFPGRVFMKPEGEKTQNDPWKFLSKVTRDALLDLTQYYPNVKLTEKNLVYVRIFIVPLILEFGCRAVLTYFRKGKSS